MQLIFIKKYNASLILEARAILDTAKIKRRTVRLRETLNNSDIRKLTFAASLAHHGLLDSVNDLWLEDVDLSPVPAQHLASLASCVTTFFTIKTVTGHDLVSILSSLKCKELIIISQSLGREETRALVRAMVTGVRYVQLCGGVTLDMEALAEYSGQGVCSVVALYHYTAARYRGELVVWARSRNWRVYANWRDGRCLVQHPATDG